MIATVISAAICTWASGASASRQEIAPGIPSWDALERALTEVEYRTLTLDEMLGCEPVRRMIGSADEIMALEMISEVRRPAVALAGFLILRKMNSEMVPRMALELLASAVQPDSMLFDPVHSYVTSLPDTQDNVRLLGAMAVRAMPRQNAAAVIRALPYALVRKWFVRSGGRGLRPLIEALIVDRLLEEASGEPKVASHLIRAALRRMCRCPGTPRYVAVTHLAETDELLHPTLRLVLTDSDLDLVSLAVLVRRRTKLIQRLIERDDLRLSPERRALIEESLRRSNAAERKLGTKSP